MTASIATNQAPAQQPASLMNLNQVMNAQQNLSMIDAALNDIRQLLLQKESLQADVAALQREKAQLTQEVQSLRVDANGYNQDIQPSTATTSPSNTTDNTAVSKRCNSLPDLSLLYDDDSDDDASVSYSDEDYSENSGLSPSDRKTEAPQHFYCPLTLSIMKHPMQQKGTKKNYERGAILEWIYFGKATCPLTRQKLHPSDFQENTQLQQEIQEWRQAHGMTDDSDLENQENMDGSELIEKLSPHQEKEQQKRRSVLQVRRQGSTKQLMSLKDRILRKRDDRIRRFSQR